METKKAKRCWEFFHCLEEAQKACLMPEVSEWRCWLVNIACCKINKEAPHPISTKKIVCKTCDYFKEYGKFA